MPEKFSLKDHLFNETKVRKIVGEISSVYPDFEKEVFVTRTVEKFPSLELKERITWISEMLREFLPREYPEAVRVLLDALPPPNDPTKTDNDFGDFIYAPYAEFVARYGCSKEYLSVSLNALREMTMRFSAEDAIRYFINAFPKETMQEILTWSKDGNYHVRRLASEGTRPKLPWAQKISIAPEDALPILDNLYFDKTRYVTRSVANHLNDISKINPELALSTLAKWQESGIQEEREMEYITNHALRTLIKQGYKNAITFLKFAVDPEVEFADFTMKNDKVVLGEALEFSFTLTAQKDEQLIIDYVLYFPNKANNGTNKKVFKIKKLMMQKGQTLLISKKHPMRKDMTTRKLSAGEHKIEIQINGKMFGEKTFTLIH
jgi:3-methyladenine DNA glycosylase AlkC